MHGSYGYGINWLSITSSPTWGRADMGTIDGDASTPLEFHHHGSSAKTRTESAVAQKYTEGISMAGHEAV